MVDVAFNFGLFHDALSSFYSFLQQHAVAQPGVMISVADFNAQLRQTHNSPDRNAAEQALASVCTSSTYPPKLALTGLKCHTKSDEVITSPICLDMACYPAPAGSMGQYAPDSTGCGEKSSVRCLSGVDHPAELNVCPK